MLQPALTMYFHPEAVVFQAPVYDLVAHLLNLVAKNRLHQFQRSQD